MIAATAIEYDVALRHNDKDFIPIAKYCDLQTVMH
jgi:predicted nucleic acid-binding protein